MGGRANKNDEKNGRKNRNHLKTNGSRKRKLKCCHSRILKFCWQHCLILSEISLEVIFDIFSLTSSNRSSWKIIRLPSFGKYYLQDFVDAAVWFRRWKILLNIKPLQLPEKHLTLIRTAPDINILPILDIVSGSLHFLPVTLNLCLSSLYDILLNFEHLPVLVTGRKRILLVTHEIMPDSDQWPAVISCTVGQ